MYMVVYKLFYADNTKLPRLLQSLFQFYSGNLKIIGALNWGAVGLFRFDCVAAIFGGQAAPISRVVYALVGLAGLWCITILFRDAPAEA